LSCGLLLIVSAISGDLKPASYAGLSQAFSLNLKTEIIVVSISFCAWIKSRAIMLFSISLKSRLIFYQVSTILPFATFPMWIEFFNRIINNTVIIWKKEFKASLEKSGEALREISYRVTMSAIPHNSTKVKKR